MKKTFFIFLCLTLILSACATEPPLPTLAVIPTQAIKLTDAPKTITPLTVSPTTAPQLTTAPQPTTPAQPAVAAPLKGEVTLWHTYEANGVEEKTFLQIIDSVKKKNPELKINVQRIPIYEITNRYRVGVKNNTAPDLFINSNDDLGDLAREKMVLDITSHTSGKLSNVAQYAIEGVKVEGKIYGIPESANTVVLYYNNSLLDKAPATTGELLNAVKSNKALAAVRGPYHLFGFFAAFGGKLLDDGGKCVADNSGFSEAMQYLSDLKKAGATLETGDADLVLSFVEGKSAMLINATWALSEYKQALGNKLSASPLPANKNKAAPFTVIDAFYVNPNSKNPQLAVDVALSLTNAESSKIFTDGASHIPIRADVKTDSLMTNLVKAASEGTPRPQSKEFNNYWSPFSEMFVRVFELNTAPADAVKQACATMNKANGK
ncbi:MAG: extracellular solute-binding protein [Chloroflexota bacterium]